MEKAESKLFFQKLGSREKAVSRMVSFIKLRVG